MHGPYILAHAMVYAFDTMETITNKRRCFIWKRELFLGHGLLVCQFKKWLLWWMSLSREQAYPASLSTMQARSNFYMKKVIRMQIPQTCKLVGCRVVSPVEQYFSTYHFFSIGLFKETYILAFILPLDTGSDLFGLDFLLLWGHTWKSYPAEHGLSPVMSLLGFFMCYFMAEYRSSVS